MLRLFSDLSISKLVMRFGLSVLCTIALTVLFLFPKLSNNPTHHILFVAGYLFFAAMQVMFESRKYTRLQYAYITIPLACVIAYVLLAVLNKQPYNSLLIGLLSVAVIAPFYFKQSKEEYVWNFQFHVLKAGLVAGVASVVLMLGVFAILGALDYLLNIRLYADQYSDVGTVIWSFIFPALILNGVPEEFEQSVDANANRWLIGLLSYVVVPVLIAYALILHVYGIKILWTQVLPKGLIAYLVGVFSFAGIATYILSAPWVFSSRIIQLYRRWFGLGMLFPLGLMALAVYERVVTYGLTSLRYVLMVLWLIYAISVVLMILRSTSLSQYFFTMVSIVSFLMVGGPLSVHNLPVQQQLYTAKGIIHSMQQKPELKKDTELSLRLTQALAYAYRQNEKKSQDYLLEVIPNAQPSNVASLEAVGKYLGVKLDTSTTRANRQYFSYRYESNQPMNIGGYAEMLEASLDTNAQRFSLSGGRVAKVKLVDGKTLSVKFEGDDSFAVNVDLSEKVQAVLSLPNSQQSQTQIRIDGKGIRVIVRRVYGYRTGGKVIVNGGAVLLLVP